MTDMQPPLLGFHGAARTVIDSCFRLQTDSGDILIDCGIFQGSRTEKKLNYRPFPFEPSRIAVVLLTQAHIDHSGLLPKLVREGYSGPIIATGPTVDLCAGMLPDSAAHIRRSKSNSPTAVPKCAVVAGSVQSTVTTTSRRP